MCCVLCWSVQLIGKYCLSIQTSRKNGCQSKLHQVTNTVWSFCSFSEGSSIHSYVLFHPGWLMLVCTGAFTTISKQDALAGDENPRDERLLLCLLEFHFSLVSQNRIPYLLRPSLKPVIAVFLENWQWVLGIKSPYAVKTESASVCCWCWRTSPNTTSVSTTLSAPQKGFLPSTFWIKFRSHCFLRLRFPLMFCEIRRIWKNCWSSPLVCVTEPNDCSCCHSSPACGGD